MRPESLEKRLNLALRELDLSNRAVITLERNLGENLTVKQLLSHSEKEIKEGYQVGPGLYSQIEDMLMYLGIPLNPEEIRSVLTRELWDNEGNKNISAPYHENCQYLPFRAAIEHYWSHKNVPFMTLLEEAEKVYDADKKSWELERRFRELS